MTFEKCLVEVDEVLNYLSKEDLEKIPINIRSDIKIAKDKEYIWKYDTSKPLNDQKLNRKSITLLSYLNMEYLLSNEQKKLMEELHKFNEVKSKKRKQEIFKEVKQENKLNKIKKENKNNEILNIKENIKWYNKLFNFIKNIFNKGEINERDTNK